MFKSIIAMLLLLIIAGCAAVEPTVTEQPEVPAPPVLIEPDINEIIEFEMRGAFDFFWEQANTNPESPGFGLIRDRYPGSYGISSIASVGFGLTAILIGIEEGYITREQGYERVSGTLETLLEMEHIEGFFYHFVNMNTGKRAWNSEISNIDTSILMMGVLSVGEYFQGDIKDKANELYKRINWNWFVDETRNMFHMAYRPETGFEGHWDFFAEQLMMYVLAAGSPAFPTDDSLYYGFRRRFAAYGDGEKFIHSWFNSIFTYQYSHAWIDFKGFEDRLGVDWFLNSYLASRAHHDFATDVDDVYKTISRLAWGLSASDGPDGYNGYYGAPPSGFDNRAHFIDDTIPPYGAIGSIIFLPEEAKASMIYYYSYEELKGGYGFKSAFNLTDNWFSKDVIGIDKGISLLMLANYRNGFVHELMMRNEHIKNGMINLGLER